MTEELIAIDKMLRQHDWHYRRSDDSRAFSRGEASSKKVHNACLAAADQDEVKRLWDKHCPFERTPYYDGTSRAVG
jgi:hypothetical protein